MSEPLAHHLTTSSALSNLSLTDIDAIIDSHIMQHPMHHVFAPMTPNQFFAYLEERLRGEAKITEAEGTAAKETTASNASLEDRLNVETNTTAAEESVAKETTALSTTVHPNFKRIKTKVDFMVKVWLQNARLGEAPGEVAEGAGNGMRAGESTDGKQKVSKADLKAEKRRDGLKRLARVIAATKAMDWRIDEGCWSSQGSDEIEVVGDEGEEAKGCGRND